LWRSVALLLIVFLRLVHLSLNYLRLAGEVFPDVAYRRVGVISAVSYI
jgi:hypothetical protein